MGQDYSLGRFILRVSERQLLDEGATVPLGGRAFEVLTTLAENPGKLVTKEQLFRRAWPDVVVEENNLQVQISTLRKALGQGAIATVFGQGYRLTLPVANIAPDAVALQEVRRHNLPQPLTGFIGHEQDLISCAELLRDARLLTLTGIGGCGKTRFAIRLGEQVLPTFPDGVWFVDLAPVADVMHVPFTVATGLQVKEVADTPLEETLSDYLTNQRLLLILDNCEHLLGACAQLAQRFLESAPGLKILATSRESLGVAGEQIVTVRSLTAPPSSADHDIELLSRSEAVRLFVERARLNMPTFALTADVGPAVADICRRLDGIPLAIELAAARAGVLSVEQIRSRLNDRFRLLVGGTRALPRHRTLGAVLQWSYEHLPAKERQLVRRLSVFVGGWPLDAASAMLETSTDQDDALTLLSGLVDKSLVEVERPHNGAPRYRMLETVRQYMLDRLEEVGETSMARTRHLNFLVDLAEAIWSSEYTGSSLGSMVPRLEPEIDNILAAHAWCDNVEGGAELGLRLVNNVSMYWVDRGDAFGLRPTDQDPLLLGHRLVTEALARRGAQARTMYRCRALYGLSFLLYLLGRFDEAETQLIESTAIARELSDLAILSSRVGTRTSFYLRRGDYAAARSCGEEALRIANQSLNRRYVAGALHVLGDVAIAQGAMTDAISYLNEGVAIARDEHPLITVAGFSVSLAWALTRHGKSKEAVRLVSEALPAILGSRARRRCADLLIVASGLAADLLDFDRAARFLGAAHADGFEPEMRLVEQRNRLDFLDSTLRSHMGNRAFESSESAGRDLAFADALEEVHLWLGTIAH